MSQATLYDPLNRAQQPLWRRFLCALGIHTGARLVVYQGQRGHGRFRQIRMGVVKSCGHYVHD